MLITLFIIGFLLVFYMLRKAQPAVDQFGQSLKVPVPWPESKDTLVVATYNIQTGKNLQGKRNILRSAEVVKQADIVGVQEVYAETWLNRLGIGVSQTKALAQHGDFAGLFAATRRRWLREHRGNALLTKLPITQWQINMLPDFTGKSYRNMLVTQFIFNHELCVLINTHLHTRKGRRQQLEVVLNEFSKYSKVILLGDFNSTISESKLQEVLLEQGVQDAISLGMNEPVDEHRIDWILIKGFKVLDAMTIKKGVSDHPYYQVTLK